METPSLETFIASQSDEELQLLIEVGKKYQNALETQTVADAATRELASRHQNEGG